MVESRELDKLITQCKEKNRKAQKKLYDTYFRRLYAICYRYCKNEAEDTLQLAFVKIFNNIDRYEGIGSFEGWIKRITINTAITEFHKRNILENSSDILDYEETSIDDKYADAVSKMSSEEIMQLIAELPDIYRISFNLYAVEGYKHNEIAEMLTISEGTSKSHISRARKLLQEKLESLHFHKKTHNHA